MFIPVNEPLLQGNEKKYLNECIDTAWISSEGGFVKQLENEIAKRVNRNFGIAVANGTAALEIAIKALDIGEGDEVIMPTFTIISCAGAIVKAGAKPVLVDSEADTWNMDISQIEAKITKRTKAIMVVHIYGLPVDFQPILEIAERYSLKIIEDAAEMHGQTYNDTPCGSLGDISTFSFYPNKHITTGEGGMILCNDEILAERCRSLRNLCFSAEQRFVHEELGWNYRMSNLQAAVGVAQLEKLDSFIEKKRIIGNLYNLFLSKIDLIQTPLQETAFARNIYWVYGIVLKKSYIHDAKIVMQKLNEVGVGTRPFFWCMHEQPVFKKMGLFENEKYPIAENLARRGFYVPSGLATTEEQIKYISEKLIKILK